MNTTVFEFITSNKITFYSILGLIFLIGVCIGVLLGWGECNDTIEILLNSRSYVI